MPSHRLVWLFAAVAIVLAPACGRKEGAPAATAAPQPPQTSDPVWPGFRPEAGPVIAAHAVTPSQMSTTEQKYGLAPQRGQGIDFQDDVVLIEHGDKAIVSWDTNGLGWTLDASNPQVAALKKGDILFATSRCIGRVLKLTRDGQRVSVILGPVQMQDVIARGNVTYHAPLDLDSLTAVEVPDDPAAFGSPVADQMAKALAGGDASGRGSIPSAMHRQVQYFIVTPRGEWRPMRTIRRPTAQSVLVDWQPRAPSVVRTAYTPQLPPLKSYNDELQATPCWFDCGGLGVRMTVNKDGLNVTISVVFRLKTPSVRFDLSITNGVWSEVELTGAAGFEVSIEGTTDPGFLRNLNQIGSLPVDLVLPLNAGGVGLEVHFHQDISLSTGFSAKTSILKAHGVADMSGGLGIDYHSGKFDVRFIHTAMANSMVSDMAGLSMGINSIVFGINQRVLVGFGVAGFAVGALRQSDVDHHGAEAGDLGVQHDADAAGRGRLPAGHVRDAPRRRHRLRPAEGRRQGRQLLSRSAARRSHCRVGHDRRAAEAGPAHRHQQLHAPALRGRVGARRPLTWTILMTRPAPAVLILGVYGVYGVYGAGGSVAAQAPGCKPVTDAMFKMETTPHHAVAMSGPSDGGGTIVVNNEIYFKVRGVWKKSPMTPQDQLEQEQENIKEAKVYTCTRLGSETVNGIRAVAYKVHSESNDVGTGDGTVWIAPSIGLPVKLDEDMTPATGAKMHTSMTWDYANIHAPLVK